MGHASLRVLTGSLAAATLAALAVAAGAQSLAEAARRERERRAKPAAAPAKAYTDADLDARRASPAATTSPSPPPAATDGETAHDEAAHDEAKRKRQQAEWRTRFADARRQTFEAEARCWHKVVETVFVSGIPVQQWVNKFEESEELRDRKRELADLEEEYRRTGLPPGWVRD